MAKKDTKEKKDKIVRGKTSVDPVMVERVASLHVIEGREVKTVEVLDSGLVQVQDVQGTTYKLPKAEFLAKGGVL